MSSLLFSRSGDAYGAFTVSAAVILIAVTGLQLRGVTKVYPVGIRALHPVDLVVRPGEFIVLVGPSGCGKSTLLRLISGLEQPTSGDILLDGESILALPPAERDVAMVFQSYALYPHMNVAENIGFGLRMRKTPQAERDRLVHETASLLGLTELLRRRPGQLSGGQRQRVALGRAIIRRPRLFLFDEPLSNLDAALRASTRAELRRLHAHLDATMIYVTHDQVEAMSMADRLVVMDKGEVQQEGGPLEVYERPVNRFVAGFIGSPAMNFLALSVTGGVPELAGVRGPALTGPVTGNVTAGFRAEHLSLSKACASGSHAVRVAWIESLGNEALITCELTDGQQVTVRSGSATIPPPGTAQWLSLRWERAVFFDPLSGNALPLSFNPLARDAAHEVALQERE